MSIFLSLFRRDGTINEDIGLTQEGAFLLQKSNNPKPIQKFEAIK